MSSPVPLFIAPMMMNDGRQRTSCDLPTVAHTPASIADESQSQRSVPFSTSFC